MEGSGGVGRHELDVHLPAGTLIRSAEGVPRSQDGGERAGGVRRVEAEVDEAGSGDLDARDAAGRHVEPLDQLLRYLARLSLQRSRQRHGQIGGPLAVRGITWTLQDRIDGLGRAEVSRRARELGTDTVRGRAVHSPPELPDEGGLGVEGVLLFPESLDASPPDEAPASDEPEAAGVDASVFPGWPCGFLPSLP